MWGGGEEEGREKAGVCVRASKKVFDIGTALRSINI